MTTATSSDTSGDSAVVQQPAGAGSDAPQAATACTQSADREETLFEGAESALAELAGTPGLLLRNGYPSGGNVGEVVRQGLDERAMSVPFIIVTRSNKLNRHGAMVQIAENERGKGVQTQNYQNNPVVMFDHGFGFSLPIAKSEDQSGNFTVKKFQNKMEATAFFSQSLPEATQIFALIAEGILRTASIAFIPLKVLRFKVRNTGTDYEVSDGGDKEYFDTRPMWGYDYLESEQLEWSVVGIPADPGAVRKFLDRGRIGTEKITQGLRPALVRMAGSAPVWSPGVDMDAAGKLVVPQAAGYSLSPKCGKSQMRFAAPTREELTKLVADCDQLGLVSHAAPPTLPRPPAAADPQPGIDVAAIVQRAVSQAVAQAVEPVLATQTALERRLQQLSGRVD